MTDDKCKRCGRCCYLPDRVCPFLSKLSDGTYTCRIYKNRFSIALRHGIVCHTRANSPVDYEGCPYNTNKPIRKTFV